MLFYVLLLSVIVLTILAIVKLGSIAFQFTGVEPKMAMFQSLSAFTNTGFTTSSAESVVQHPTRRLIASILIFMGYIGVAGLIVTLIRSFSSDSGTWLPTLVRLLISLLCVYALYFIFILTPPGRKLGQRFARLSDQKNK
jgi:Trk-type K+ transport system membrane component